MTSDDLLINFNRNVKNSRFFYITAN